MQFGACVQESDNIVVDSCCFRALSFRYIVWSFKQWCFAAVSNTGRLYVWGNAPLTMFSWFEDSKNVHLSRTKRLKDYEFMIHNKMSFEIIGKRTHETFHD